MYVCKCDFKPIRRLRQVTGKNMNPLGILLKAPVPPKIKPFYQNFL